MPDRKGHYLTTPGRATAPASLVVVVPIKTHDRELSDAPGVATATLAAVEVRAARRSRGRWTATDRQRFDDAESFWGWLERWSFSGRKTYVVAPVASDALTLLGFWRSVDVQGAKWMEKDKGGRSRPPAGLAPNNYLFRRLVLKGGPDIIDYVRFGKSYCWLSVRNYLTADAQTLAPAPTSAPARPTRRRPLPEVPPADLWQTAADTWIGVFQRLSDWWLKLDCGGWAPTAGAMGKRFLDSRCPPKSVSTHKCEPVLRLERLACHRGRTSCWFYGESVGPTATPDDACGVPYSPYPLHPTDLIHIDVRSMYPWLLSTVRLPTRLISHRERIDVQTLKALCVNHCCTASVRLDTPRAEYPHRTDSGIVYPTGKFTAYLSGQELERALADGVVTHVHEAAIYAAGRVWAPAARELLGMRTAARASGDKGWELFVKLLSNSLTGKLAQRKSRWVERPQHPPEKRWGEWPENWGDSGGRKRFRALAGLVWEQLREEGGTGTLTACYGHLTAACSAHMRRIRESLPERSVVSQDTDGIWCRPEAADTLAAKGFQFGEEPGCLRVTDRSVWSRFWGPKHYLANRRWKLSGFCDPVPAADGLTFLDTVTLNAVRSSPHGVPQTVSDARRAVTLNMLPTGGAVGRDGWLVPDHLPRRVSALPPLQDRDQGDGNRQDEKGKGLFDDVL